VGNREYGHTEGGGQRSKWSSEVVGGCNRFGEISMILAVNAVFCSASGLLLRKMGIGCFGEFIIRLIVNLLIRM
jgi:hypothetical protein